MSRNIIEVKNLTKTYKIYNKPMDRLKEAISVTRKCYSRDFHALQDISFTVRKGENIGIIGTNGSGKSTLLKIITGVLSSSAGEVIVNGKISALLELGAGFNPEYTGIENIYLNGTMMGFTKEQMDEKLQDILDFAGIGEFVEQPVKTYSSGMFARLAFAVAINVEPDILIVDEALSVGDTRFQLKCMKRMKEMMSGGTTVLFVSHDVNAIKRFCTRAVWLNRGVIKGDGEVRAITDQYLDYLKKGEAIVVEDQDGENQDVIEGVDNEVPFEPGNTMAEIVAFHFRDVEGNIVNDIGLYQPVEVELVYDVYEEKVEKPVVGIAIRGMDNDYVCGLNTLIDGIPVPWEYGRNRMILTYPQGILSVGGRYYFDAALMDETASVNMHYLGMAKEFTITSGYVGEGRYIIPHKWEGKDE